MSAHPALHSSASRISAGVSVRRAVSSDLDTVVRLRLALLHESSGSPIYRRIKPDAGERARAVFAAQLDALEQVIFLAERDGRAIGILRCVASFASPLLEPDGYGYISSAYVVPQERRRGVLSALLAVAEEWCAERGLEEMRLHNVPDIEAANLAWDALGFQVVELVRMRPVRTKGDRSLRQGRRES